MNNLIPRLSGKWHVVAPDLPGFSAAPRVNSFDHLAEVIARFIGKRGLTRFAVMVFDHGAHDPAGMAPEAHMRESYFLDQPGSAEIQLDLFLDYQSNVALYPAIQHYLRANRPALLAVRGRNDPFFLPAGAQAFRRDVPGAQIHFVDAGQLGLEGFAANADRFITSSEEVVALDCHGGCAAPRESRWKRPAMG